MAESERARNVADGLASAIMSGELAADQKLPSLRDLMAQHGIAMVTAKRVMELLVAKGLASSRPREGYFVRRRTRIRRRSPGRLSRDRWGSGETIQAHDSETRSKTVDVAVGRSPAPDFAAAALGVESGTMVIFRARRYLIDDQPVQLATSYLPMDLAQGTQIESPDSGPGGIYARLAEAGHGPETFTERIVYRQPTPEEAERLRLFGDGARVCEITREARGGSRCVEVNRMILAADVYELEYSFDA